MVQVKIVVSKQFKSVTGNKYELNDLNNDNSFMWTLPIDVFQVVTVNDVENIFQSVSTMFQTLLTDFELKYVETKLVNGDVVRCYQNKTHETDLASGIYDEIHKDVLLEKINASGEWEIVSEYDEVSEIKENLKWYHRIMVKNPNKVNTFERKE